MNIEMREPGRKLNGEDVRALEADIGQTLPDSYRFFLLRNNGGLPGPKRGMYIVDVLDLPGSPTDVQVFFGIDRVPSDIRSNVKGFSDRFDTTKLLPIARDSGGNIFCLWLDEPNYGSVAYIDWTDWEEHEATPYMVADSFDSFLDKIRPM